MSTPSPNGSNGRDPNGRFAAGWKGGPGNPHARRVNELRALLLGAVTDADLKAAVKALVKKAKKGDVPATRELLDRLLGKPAQALEVSSPDGTMGTQAVVAAVLEALADQPEARARVAAKLLEQSRE